MKKAWIRFKCVIFKADPGFVEIWCGLLTFAMGIFLLLPMRTFTEVSVWFPLAKIMSEEWWAILFIIVGALKVFCYLLGNFTQRRYCLFIMALLWSFVTTTILTGWHEKPYSSAPVLFIFITTAIVWAFLRVGIMRTIRESLYGKRSDSARS
jgi:hypothetical protein